MFCGIKVVGKLELDPERELERPFFVAAVTPKWLETSSLSYSLNELNRAGSSAGSRSNFVLHFRALFAAIVYSFEESSELEMFSRSSFERACKSAATPKERTCTRLMGFLRFRVVLGSKV